MIERIEQLRAEAEGRDRGGAATSAELEELRVRYLGRKAELPQMLRGVAELEPDAARRRSARPPTRRARRSSG